MADTDVRIPVRLPHRADHLDSLYAFSYHFLLRTKSVSDGKKLKTASEKDTIHFALRQMKINATNHVE